MYNIFCAALDKRRFLRYNSFGYFVNDYRKEVKSMDDTPLQPEPHICMPSSLRFRM
ncbi:(2Fe-2S)-binding protein [Centipeda periodontii DSM 2778]|uniref:(2Fe-2S)-binding protein n=1 Tax=Centipeda periodontii DSM 2778 TaxID=888060 RepID=F5RP61_9FIRM|nr:(2Fe-2S)-binding protein [Centipeda periodontii DSM 2778]